MIADRVIDTYLKEVAGELPFGIRRESVAELKEKIYDMLDLYCEGGRPSMRDAKTVLRSIGSPKEVAGSYREKVALAKRKGQKKTLRYLRRIREFIFAAAVLMMLSGLLSVVLGRTGHAAVFLLGAATAVAVMVVRIIWPVSPDAPEPDQDSKEAWPLHDTARSTGDRYRY